MSNGTQIILAEAGHSNDLWGAQPEAMNHLLATFIDNGQIDDSMFTYSPMDFQVRFGFPALAKISILILVALSIGLMGLLSTIFSRSSAKKRNQIDHQGKKDEG